MNKSEDQSHIQLVTGNSGGSFDLWHPGLYLQSAFFEKIKLDAPLEFAWAKMKMSMIWKWAAAEDGATPAVSLSIERIVQALEILAGEKNAIFETSRQRLFHSP